MRAVLRGWFLYPECSYSGVHITDIHCNNTFRKSAIMVVYYDCKVKISIFHRPTLYEYN